MAKNTNETLIKLTNKNKQTEHQKKREIIKHKNHNQNMKNTTLSEKKNFGVQQILLSYYILNLI